MMNATTAPAAAPSRTGAHRRVMYTPALTMVLECSSAEQGVGATIAPSSHFAKGNCAALFIPAKQIKSAGSITADLFITDKRFNSTVWQ